MLSVFVPPRQPSREEAQNHNEIRGKALDKEDVTLTW